jgi:hypothetical protein
MKNITGEEDFYIPTIFLFIYSLVLGMELRALPENMNKVYSIVLSEPILFADGIIKTASNFSMFLFPVLIIFVAFKQKHYLLKIAFLLGTIPFILSDSIIIKLGYKSIFVVNVAIIFIVVMLLINYLTRTIGLYKIALKQKTDNKGNTADRQATPASR